MHRPTITRPSLRSTRPATGIAQHRFKRPSSAVTCRPWLLALCAALIMSAAVASANPRAPVASAKPGVGTCAAVGLKIGTMSTCRYGVPVVVGKVLFVPKACKIPIGKRVITRHTVELRDLATGRKQGQASLPAVRIPAASAAKTAIPKPGALIGGPYPLFVHDRAIAAIDASSRRARVVFEATGTIAGVARYGELLAIVERLPKAGKRPAGVLEWTVLDFGAGEILGQSHLAPTQLLDVGLGKEGGQLVSWLGVKSAKGSADLVAPVRTKAGKPATTNGRLAAVAKRRGQRFMAHGSRAKSGTKPACVVLTGRDSVLPSAVWVDLGAKSGTSPAAAARTLPIAGCLAATGGSGRVWAWHRSSAGNPELRAYQCK